MSAYFELVNLSKSFGGPGGAFHELRHGAGELTGLMGPNGAGKPLFQPHHGGVHPDEGQILFKGEDLGP